MYYVTRPPSNGLVFLLVRSPVIGLRLRELNNMLVGYIHVLQSPLVGVAGMAALRVLLGRGDFHVAKSSRVGRVTTRLLLLQAVHHLEKKSGFVEQRDVPLSVSCSRDKRWSLVCFYSAA